MRYHFALVDWEHPVGNPLALVRVEDGHEEIFVPPRGWVSAEPRTC